MLGRVPEKLILRFIQKTSPVSFARLYQSCRVLSEFIKENAKQLRITIDKDSLEDLEIIISKEESKIQTIHRISYNTKQMKPVAAKGLIGYRFPSISLFYIRRKSWNHWNHSDEFYQKMNELMKDIKSVACKMFHNNMESVRKEALLQIYQTIRFEAIRVKGGSDFDFPQVKECRETSCIWEGSRKSVVSMVHERECWRFFDTMFTANKLLLNEQVVHSKPDLFMASFCSALSSFRFADKKTDFFVNLQIYQYASTPKPEDPCSLLDWTKLYCASYELHHYLSFMNLLVPASTHVILKKGSSRHMVLVHHRSGTSDVYVMSVDPLDIDSIFRVLYYTLLPLDHMIADLSDLYEKWSNSQEGNLFEKVFADFTEILRL